MGLLVSILSGQDAPTNPTQTPPQFIALPPPLLFSPDPLESPLYSPGLEMYHTAPSTPITSPSVEVPSYAAARAAEPSLPHLQITIPVAPPSNIPADLVVEEAFPTGEIPVDFVDDEGLTALEKIYLFARSQSVFHRLYIVHALPAFLELVTPQEAIEYVLPLIPGLAMDEDEKVKEALVSELLNIIWWFFTNCQVIPDDLGVEETVYSPHDRVEISVQAFTPILGTLLLSPNSKVGGAAKYVVVNILSRMRTLDRREAGILVSSPSPLLSPSAVDADSDDEQDPVQDIPIGLFGREERLMFEQELLQQVVIGMGRLDLDIEDVEMVEAQVTHRDWHFGEGPVHPVNSPMAEVPNDENLVVSPHEPDKADDDAQSVNSYFPVLPSYSVPSPGSSNSSTPSTATDTSSSSSTPSVHLNSTPPPASHHNSPRLRSPQSENPPASPISSRRTSSRAPSEAGTDDRGTDEGDGDQASVGRLSSMSLMAAVTANGCVDDDTQKAFVKEVERVGHDPVYWVRREASYALGALAKVVPDEIVLLSLIPLFDSLRRDSQWHVRHSALFALPAILSRLTPSQRRSLALDAIIPLSVDESQSVRIGALESLGEVLYTFHEDDDGPPQELVQLFLGRREDKRVRDGQQAMQRRDEVLNSLFGRSPPPPEPISSAETPLTSFYTDPARPLICAFNYPAVALTLGPNRWAELREVYLEIAENKDVAVRRSLAASLGELAKIIGGQNAERDLLQEEVREKALDCCRRFVGALDKEARIKVVNGLLTTWEEGIFRGWRERKTIAKALVSLARAVGSDLPVVVRGLLKNALQDGVAAVREAAVSALPHLWSLYWDEQAIQAELRADIRALSASEAYRHRMTFVACFQALVVGSDSNQSLVTSDDELWSAVSSLADDTVIGVRIGIARLVRVASERFQSSNQRVSGSLLDVIRHLSLDASHDVRSYVRDSLSSTPQASSSATPAEVIQTQIPRRSRFATFSRPPPPPSSHPLLSLPTRPVTGSSQEDEMADANSNSPKDVLRLKPASAEFVKEQSDSKRAITVPG
ncbi:armadillo-type protein [Roridomyces roridus]|uniref:Armadillo-type protein n=1 Tax=Roridomyces roridus TaxID=1738132 RepID=A0AAD7FPU9_9AGAR|nr:armadillo-type protein [Roridomyces roridus]